MSDFRIVLSISSAIVLLFYVPLKSRSWRMVISLLLSLLILVLPLPGQDPGSSTPQDKSGRFSRALDFLFNYLDMAGTQTADTFRPLTQQERTHIYLKSMVNPLGFIETAISAGLDQWNDKPEEWEQGASGYGKRFGNILGQSSIQRTVTFGASSILHEDNRYFNSGKTGFWPRTGYALASGILARKDDGSRTFSISQTTGVAAGALLSRLWLPSSQHSVGDAAVSFGITMGSNMAFSAVKEFLPDLGRAITGKHKKPSRSTAPIVSR